MCCKDLQKKFPGKEKCFDEKLRAEEEGIVFMIDSKESFCRVQIDKCLVIDNNIRKCDFAFVRCEKLDFYYVELKSNYKEIEHAYDQIKITIQTHFPADLIPHETPKKKRTYGFIVYGYKEKRSRGERNRSKIPQADQRLRILQDRFKKECGEKLEIVRSPYIHRI